MTCSTGNALRSAWYATADEVVTRLKLTVPNERRVIELRNADPEYQAALEAYKQHRAECAECKKDWR